MVTGVREERREVVEDAMSEAVTASCGYEARVTLEKIRYVDVLD